MDHHKCHRPGGPVRHRISRPVPKAQRRCRYFFGHLAKAVLFIAGLLVPVMGWCDSNHMISLTFREKGNDCQFEGSFDVSADPYVVWDVLTDYNHRSQFVSNVSCHVLQRDENGLLVAMTVGGGFLFIREEAKGLLKVREDGLRSLSFEETSHRQFDSYQGAWELQPDPQGGRITVTYRLETAKNRSTPSFVTSDAICQSSLDLMVQMRREMLRREEKIAKEVHHG